MRYALNLGEDGRILSATFAEFASENMVLVEKIPEDNISNYRYVDGIFVYEPVFEGDMEDVPTRIDALEAQVAYTAMMTDTLLEV